jgi:hypothetical protein
MRLERQGCALVRWDMELGRKRRSAFDAHSSEADACSVQRRVGTRPNALEEREAGYSRKKRLTAPWHMNRAKLMQTRLKETVRARAQRSFLLKWC